MVDKTGLSEIDKAARATEDAVKTGRWKTATNLWSNAEGVILKVTRNIDFYNILAKTSYGYGRFLSNPMIQRGDEVH